MADDETELVTSAQAKQILGGLSEVREYLEGVQSRITGVGASIANLNVRMDGLSQEVSLIKDQMVRKQDMQSSVLQLFAFMVAIIVGTVVVLTSLGLIS